MRREFPLTFIVANTPSILGADFLTHIDTKLESHLSDRINIRVTTSTRSLVFKDHPEQVSSPDYTSLPSTKVCHKIITDGALVYCKARPLSLHKLETAKKEFDALLKLNIIRPSSEKGRWINATTVADRYPIPNLQTFHHQNLICSRLTTSSR